MISRGETADHLTPAIYAYSYFLHFAYLNLDSITVHSTQHRLPRCWRLPRQ